MTQVCVNWFSKSQRRWVGQATWENYEIADHEVDLQGTRQKAPAQEDGLTFSWRCCKQFIHNWNISLLSFQLLFKLHCADFNSTCVAKVVLIKTTQHSNSRCQGSKDNGMCWSWCPRTRKVKNLNNVSNFAALNTFFKL